MGGKNLLTENHVSGKRKKAVTTALMVVTVPHQEFLVQGGMYLEEDSLVCNITVGEYTYPVRAVVPGQLMEANDRLQVCAPSLSDLQSVESKGVY